MGGSRKRFIEGSRSACRSFEKGLICCNWHWTLSYSEVVFLFALDA
jgi:hypothetical protein